MKLVLRQFLNCQGRSLQRGVQVHVDDCPLLTRFYVIAGFTLMSSQGALRAAPRTAREVVRCAGNVSWLNILMDQSLLVSRSQATATCALCRHAASEALPELGSTAPAWRPAEKPLAEDCVTFSYPIRNYTSGFARLRFWQFCLHWQAFCLVIDGSSAAKVLARFEYRLC